MRNNISQALNDEQRAAVEAGEGPLLVIAAAGTGKTRTLTYRVARLISGGVPAERILLLTFTNRAAREMLQRARELAGEHVGGLWGGTFHHAANRMLHRFADRLNFKSSYAILDRDDSRALLRRIVRDMDLAGRHFPKPEVLLAVGGLAANTGRPLRELVQERFSDPIDPEAVLRVMQAYSERKRELQGMDFDDLLVFALRLLEEHEDVRRLYQQRFLHIMVDEYQDTNWLQARFVDLLAGRHRNLLVVGDDFQSIYSWRGADFRNIMTFTERYPDAKMFKLETNYRSVPEVLAVANACIAGNPKQYQKRLRPVRENYRRPRLVSGLRDGREQARYVVRQLALLKREGYRPEQVAVLYRAHYHAMELQMELTHQRIPYLVTSGVRFFEQVHIKDSCALLRLLANPRDELSFNRLVQLLPRVGARTANRLWRELDKSFAPYDGDSRKLLVSLLPKPAVEEAEGLLAVGAELERGRLDLTPAAVIEEFVARFYGQYAEESFDNAQRRLEELTELVTLASEYNDLAVFLDEMALLSGVDSEDEVRGAAESIRLSSIHQAKGLEWRVVFVLWTVDGMLPAFRALEDPGGEEEERRLFYVAVTRAQDELYLCVPRMRRSRDGDHNYCLLSRFVDEIDAGLLERVRGPDSAR